jgi:hypothetical protein
VTGILPRQFHVPGDDEGDVDRRMLIVHMSIVPFQEAGFAWYDRRLMMALSLRKTCVPVSPFGKRQPNSRLFRNAIAIPAGEAGLAHRSGRGFAKRPANSASNSG